MTSKTLATRALRPRLQAVEFCNLRFAPCMPEPERIVGLGFRYWMLGLTTGDISSWERAWDLYCGLFGTAGARQAVSNLSHWVAAVGNASRRDIEVFPESCRSFCRDECIAVSLIAAGQHHTCPAMHTCARVLIESARVDDVVCKAQAFADTLASLEHRLSPSSVLQGLSCSPVQRSQLQ